MHILRNDFSAVIERSISVEIIELNAELGVAKVTRKFGDASRNMCVGLPDDQCLEGFFDLSEKDVVLARGEFTPLREYELCTPEMAEYLTTPSIHIIFEGIPEDLGPIRRIKEFKQQPLLDLFATGAVSLKDVARREYGLLRRLNGDYIPHLIPFDFMHGVFSNLNYDLTKAAAHLRSHPDVLLSTPYLKYAGRYQADPSVRRVAPPSDVEVIFPIPHFARDNGATEQISFLYRPAQEAMNSLVARMVALSARRSNPDYIVATEYQAIDELDLLGLAAVGARLERQSPEYWQSGMA